jgi:hypothetical protein
LRNVGGGKRTPFQTAIYYWLRKENGETRNSMSLAGFARRCIFITKISIFYIAEGLGVEKVRVFVGHWVYLYSFGDFCPPFGIFLVIGVFLVFCI